VKGEGEAGEGLARAAVEDAPDAGYQRLTAVTDGLADAELMLRLPLFG
jgi:hypothetical protein